MNIDRLPIVKLPIEALIIVDSPRRSGENLRHIRTLAEANGDLPPIVVHHDTMRVIDGLHRLRAAQMRGEKEIEARLFEGDDNGCYILAIKLNVTHGLPLSLSDRKAAAARIIRLYPDWSDRLVASIAGIAPGTAGSIRTLHNAQRGPSDQAGQLDARVGGQLDAKVGGQLDARVGRDGRKRPRNVEERKALAAKLILENPGATLRQIAAQARISPETVRAVRAMAIPNKRAAVKDVRNGREPASAQRPLDSRPDKQNKSALGRLRRDPAFRSTELGRLLLRMLGFPEVIERYDNELIAQIPPHCRENVSIAALECAEAWQIFASNIGSMQGQ